MEYKIIFPKKPVKWFMKSEIRDSMYKADIRGQNNSFNIQLIFDRFPAKHLSLPVFSIF